MYDLFNLLVPGSSVTGLYLDSFGESGNYHLNDSGQIALSGTIGGQTHALRLDPVFTAAITVLANPINGGTVTGGGSFSAI